MKREFLQEMKVDGQSLPKAMIDAIMEENGRDIEAAKRSFEDYETIQNALAEARKTIQGYEALDVDGLQQNAKDWEAKYNDALLRHAAEMAQLRFDGVLKDAITAAGGRNHKAITALLDVAALQSQEDPQSAVEQALEAVKQECAYLFGAAQTPPPYARGTGSRMGENENTPATLAGALRERFERK